MLGIKCLITRYISDVQPGFVECKFHDAWNNEHIFHEKIPVITKEDIDAKSTYPANGAIGCCVMRLWKDEMGRSLVTVSTEIPWAIETTKGLREFDLLSDQVIGL